MNFNKIFKILNQDISWVFKTDIFAAFKQNDIFCAAERRGILRSGDNQRIKVNRRFLTVVILLIFIAGFWCGNVYGADWYKKARGVFYKLESSFPALSDLRHFFQKSTVSELKPQVLLQPISPDYIPQTTQEQAVINVVKKSSPAVVSIIITKEIEVYENYFEEGPNDFFGPDSPFRIEIPVPKSRPKGKEKRTVGGGTGFIISADGMILTNKHVVSDKDAEYSVVANDGKKYPAKVLAKDPFQDLAILSIVRDKDVADDGDVIPKPFPILPLGDSDKIQIGQTVVAIGNALGEFSNTVSVGIISGLSRTITASGAGMSEVLEDIIQTDAAINKGNSGGPLLNLKGEVIGINSAVAEQAQNIGFAILINKAKKDIKQVKEIGKIVYPFLGVRYILITSEVQEEKKLPVDYGALIEQGNEPEEIAIVPGSQAEKAGLKANDIILEADGEKVTIDNSLSKIIQRHYPGDKVLFKILRNKKEIKIDVVLGEKSSEE